MLCVHVIHVACCVLVAAVITANVMGMALRGPMCCLSWIRTPKGVVSSATRIIVASLVAFVIITTVRAIVVVSWAVMSPPAIVVVLSRFVVSSATRITVRLLS